jgi:hypothetical protein
VLGPLGLLGLMPLVALQARGFLRRGLQTAAAVLLAGAVAGIHGTEVLFTGRLAPSLGITGSEHPLAVVQAVWAWLLGVPALGVEALILAVAASSLALVVRGSDLTIAMFAGALVSATLIGAPNVTAAPLVLSGWAIYVALTVMSHRRPQEAAQRRRFGAVLRLTRAGFSNRLKAVGGPRRPRPRQPVRAADAG